MINRKQIDRVKEDLKNCRADLLQRLDTKEKRKDVAEKSGESIAYLSDFHAGRKIISDKMVVKILDRVVV